MEFRIADTFTDSLARLTGDEQKAVKTAAFDLQLDPASPGLAFHKVERARDKRFWSVRVNRDVRIIVHRLPDSLMLCYVDHHDFAGDLGQRIFQLPFSWRALGVDVRGRSGTLRVNYRTSHQIRTQADRLLGTEIADVDGNVEQRSGTVSVFNGPPPVLAVLDTADDEAAAVGRWLAERRAEGVQPDEMAIFVRSPAQLPRAQAAAEAAGLPCTVLDEQVQTKLGHVAVGTMHLSKGLEFRAVAVMACDDEVVPLQERIEAVADEADLAEVYDTERYLLYVACTRARDHLLVTGVEPASEFLGDLRG